MITNYQLAILGFLCWLVFAWVFRLLFYAPYCLWNSRRLDNQDLEHILGGKFIGDVFQYQYPRGDLGIGPLVLNLHGGEINDLKNKFLEKKISAPQNSFAYLSFKFRKQERFYTGCKFYTINAHGKEVKIEDISEVQKIFINEQGKFSIKLTCDHNYNIEDSASLIATMSGWRKI